MREALFYEELENKSVQCNLCPRKCVIAEGDSGFCRVRKNEKGVLYSLNYGRISSISNDPIEKKPLYHFHPSSKILSVGSWGCNLLCPWCQNWEIAHESPQTQKVYPERLIDIAVDRMSPGIAYTYNEPITWFEFVLDTSRMASAEGLYNVMVTNGYIEQAPFKLLSQTIQAMNIDLKGFNDKFYKKRCGSELEVIMKNIETAVKEDVHVEITTLIIPGENDSESEMEEQSKWLASIDPYIPIHISKYFPAYRFNKPETDSEKIMELCRIAKKHLKFVYAGNIETDEFTNTYCHNCGSVLVERQGFKSELTGISEGVCDECRAAVKMIL